MSQKRHTASDEPHFLVRTLAAEFADGQSLAPHAHSWGQLIYSISGVVSVWTEHGSWVVPPQWAVWAPAGVRHALGFIGATSLRTLYLRPGLFDSLEESAVIPVSPLLRELILRTIGAGFLDDRVPVDGAIAHLIVHELQTPPEAALDLPLPQSERLRGIAEQLARTPGDRSGHAELARRAGIGARTLERGFLAETGLSLGRWRKRARFLHALRRLGSGAAVKDAAHDAGYRSPSAFIAAFRAALHSTPGQYFQESAKTKGFA
jgi:AraC-like DNA-binding protein